MNPLQLVLALGTWGQSLHWHLVWAMGVLFLLAVVAGVGGRRRWSAATTHGSARWARPREVQRAGLYGRHGVVVGRLGGRRRLDDSETHVLLCAPTGSGKGVGTVAGALLAMRTRAGWRLAWRGRTLITDPTDGEHAAITATGRAAAGHRVACFTPCRSPQACMALQPRAPAHGTCASKGQMQLAGHLHLFGKDLV